MSAHDPSIETSRAVIDRPYSKGGSMRAQTPKRGRAIFAALVLMTTCTLLFVLVKQRPDLKSSSGSSLGSPRLVSIEELTDYGEICAPEPPSRNASLIAALEDRNLFATFQDTSVHAASPETGDTAEVTRPPIRTIKDTYPIYSSVAVDPVRDEIVLQDTNLFGIKIFNRLDNTPPNVEATQPKRAIEGRDTKNEYNNGLYVDAKSGDIYNVAMDTADAVFVFRGGTSGNTEPQRILKVPHRGFQLAVDEEKQELYSTNQYPPRVLVFPKNAPGDANP